MNEYGFKLISGRVMKSKSIRFSILIFAFFAFFSCSPFLVKEKSLFDYNFRSLSSTPKDLEYYLYVDRFHYYLKEFTHFFEGKVDDDVIEALKSITPQDVLDEGFPLSKLKSAQNYDLMIHKVLTTKAPSVKFSKTTLKWNYNFLKNKLNEAYILSDPRVSTNEGSWLFGQGIEHDKFASEKLDASVMTLDSDHYISNRTTRAVFWEASDSGRTVEFHIGDQRDFLKHVTLNGGTIKAEVRPMARNYNKIFLVQYPDEEMARVSITNVGGVDRLEHLGYHLNLTNFKNLKLNNQLRIYGNLAQYHERMQKRLSTRFQLMPKADRVMIGQKGAIESLFTTLRKFRAISNLADSFPQKMNVSLSEAEKVKALLADPDVTSEKMIANSSAIDKFFELHKVFIESNPDIIPPDFKVGGFSTSLADISDIAFTNANGKDVRWRVVSNMWGDEILPIARALKETGQKNITYIGTAGAFPDKGYQIGDLVIPDSVQKGNVKSTFRGQSLQIERAKKGGHVRHVGSPFEETQDWLKKFKSSSDLVEIETSYLARIFDGPNDHVRAYLLVSDILGKEGETLASASSSKRRASLNALLSKILERDKAALPSPIDFSQSTDKIVRIRKAVDEILGKKAVSYRHFAVSHFLNESGVPSAHDVVDFEARNPAFTDAYFNGRLLEASEVTSYLVREMSDKLPVPTIELPKKFIDGTWNPKQDKLTIRLFGKTKKTVEGYEAILEGNSEYLAKLKNYAEFVVVRGSPEITSPHFKPTSLPDQDLLLDIYTKASLYRTGMDHSIGINGNITYSFLPTVKSQNLCSPSHCQLAFFAPDNKTAEFFEEVKTIPGLNPRKILDETIEKFNQRWFKIEHRHDNKDFRIKAEVEDVQSLPGGRLAEIVPEYNASKGVVVKVKLTAAAKNHAAVLLEEAAHLTQMMPLGFFQNPAYWTEIALNAQYGSKRSQLILAQAEVDAVDIVRNYFASADDPLQKADEIEKFVSARKAHAEKIVTDIKSEVSAENKIRKGIEARWKELQSRLEDEKVKFDQYIAANNRKKVKELISAYMPWSEMEPTEISSWTRWLEAIENPSTKAADQEVLFRGLDGDLVRQSNEGGHFFMSTMLTKNQGNYTRRLRSLKTYDKKLGKLAHEVPAHVRSLARSMSGHSHDPVGSPWLSAASYSIAEDFAREYEQGPSLVAFKLDKKRYLNNYISNYGEFERMIPLIIFPDEVIEIKDGEEAQQDFFKRVEKKLGRKLTSAEKDGVDRSSFIKESTQQWWEAINPKGIKPTNVGPTCKQMMERFLEHSLQ